MPSDSVYVPFGPKNILPDRVIVPDPVSIMPPEPYTQRPFGPNRTSPDLVHVPSGPNAMSPDFM